MSGDFHRPKVELVNGEDFAVQDYELRDNGCLVLESEHRGDEIIGPGGWVRVYDDA